MKIDRNNTIDESADVLRRRKDISRSYLRSLSPLEKISKLLKLQEQYYQFLEVREKNGGKPIPENWKKWHRARLEYAKTLKSSP